MDAKTDIEVAHDLLQALVGGKFWTMLVSFTVQLHIEVEGGTHPIQTGCMFTLAGPDGDFDIDPEGDPGSVAPFLPLLRKATVSMISVAEPATLRVEFDTGHSFSIAADDHYEAWDVSGTNGMLIVATPGGGVSVWEPEGGSVARGGKGEIWKADS